MGKAKTKAKTTKQPNARDFFEWIGRCLTQWSVVEQRTYGIFSLSFPQPGAILAAYAAYWTVHSFEDRLKMTHNAFETRFRSDQAVMAKWKTIRTRLRQQNEIRNRMAHGTVLGFWKEGGTRTELVPYMFASFGRPTKQPFADTMKLDELKQANADFEQLEADMVTFTTEAQDAAKATKPA